MLFIKENGILNRFDIFAHVTYYITFDLSKGPADTFSPLSPNVNNANIESSREP